MDDTDPVSTEDSGRDSKGRFGSGNPGRPKGTRHKIGKAFLKDIHADWTANGAEALKRLRADKPDVYVKVVAELLPKEVEIKGQHEHTHRAVSDTTTWLAGLLGAGETDSLPPSVPH